MRTVSAEWIQIEDNPPNKKVMCLCKDGKVRFGIPICGDGYFYVDSRSGGNKVEFWQAIPKLTSVKKAYWDEINEEHD